MSVNIKPVAPDLWPDFEDLFGKQGACYGCWCTHFRLPPAVRRENDRERNKDHIKTRIEAGPPPGLTRLHWPFTRRWTGAKQTIEFRRAYP